MGCVRQGNHRRVSRLSRPRQLCKSYSITHAFISSFDFTAFSFLSQLLFDQKFLAKSARIINRTGQQSPVPYPFGCTLFASTALIAFGRVFVLWHLIATARFFMGYRDRLFRPFRSLTGRDFDFFSLPFGFVSFCSSFGDRGDRERWRDVLIRFCQKTPRNSQLFYASLFMHV
jgi:hypothetical protein